MPLSADGSPPPVRHDPEPPAETSAQGESARGESAHGESAQGEIARGESARGETDEPAGTAGRRDPATLPGLPRLFFADEPDGRQERTDDRPYAQPTEGAQGSAPDRPDGLAQPNGLGDPARPGHPGGLGDQTQPGHPGEPGDQTQPGRPGEPSDQTQPGHPGGLGQQAPWQPAAVGRPATRPAGSRPTRQPDRELRQRAVASLLLGVLSLVALFGLGGGLRRFVYLLIFSAVIGVASAVIGVTAVLKARRTGTYRPRGAVGGIVLGALAAMLSIPILALYIAFPRQVDNYMTCLSHAQATGGSDKACMDRFYRSIHLGAPGSGSGRPAPPSRTPAGREIRARPAGPAAPARLAQGRADGPPGRFLDDGGFSLLAHRST